MSKPRTLLERISPANALVVDGRIDTGIQETRTNNEGGEQQALAGDSASQLSGHGTATQLSAASSAQTGTTKRKRRAADDGDAERAKGERQGRPQKLLAPWFPVAIAFNLPSPSASFADRLHVEVLALTSYLSPTPQERRARSLLVSYITALVRERWPARHGRDDGVIVHTFGSVATGLELPGGDIDLVLEFRSNLELTAKDRKTRLFQLGAVLRSREAATVVRDVNIVARARVPIVTVHTVDELGGFSIDISIRQSNPSESSHEPSSSSQVHGRTQTQDPALSSIPLIRSLLDSQPALRHLVLAMKLYLSSHTGRDSGKGGLGSAATGGIGSYVLVCMCIAYLVRTKLLDIENVSTIDSAERATAARVDSGPTLPSPALNLGTLLIGFLRYYGHEFEYVTHYVCAKSGGDAPRRRIGKDGAEIVWGEKLEKKEAVEGDEKKPKLVQEKLGVACLIDVDKDVARGCSRLSEVRAAFIEAVEILDGAGRSVGENEQESILGKILGVSQSTIEQRARVVGAVDSGKYETATLRQMNHLGRPSPVVDWRGRGDGGWRRGATDGYGPSQRRQDYSTDNRNARSYRR